MKRAWIALLAVAALALAGPAYSDSLYTEDAGGLLSDRLGDRRSNLGPGALVTVIVTENMSASSGATTKANKTSRLQTSWDLGTLLPVSSGGKSAIDLYGKTDFQGDGITKRADTVTLLVTATIQEILPDGSLRLHGKKNMRVNDEESTVELSGVVRPYDIDEGNNVKSTKIANLKVDFRGAGSASAKATPGILTRVLNWLF